MASVVDQHQPKTRSSSAVDGTTPPGNRDDATVERDIDGVPLRDHKKIDLKLILGHTPQVEEDDETSGGSAGSNQQPPEAVSFPVFSDNTDEYEYGYSDSEEGNREGFDEDDEEREPRQIQRRSSLKTIHHPTDVGDESPGFKKAVRFADALGLGLAAVRDLINADEPPEVPPSALKDLRIRKKRKKTGKELHLSLGFDQPSADPEFMVRLHEQKVVLENCVASDRDLFVSGIVRVANIAFEKRVFVRYSMDAWATHDEVPTTYVPNSNDGITDRFMFSIRLPKGFGQKVTDRLEFAVQFLAGADGVFWDSNGRSNYAVNCASVLPVDEPPGSKTQGVDFESSGSDGEFII